MTSEYVMVPVPEEQLEAVQKYLTWGVDREEHQTLDSTLVTEIVDATDDRALEFLSLIARSSLDEVPLSIAQLARRIGCGERELMGIVVEVNQAVIDSGGGQFLLQLREAAVVPAGEPALFARIVFMSEQVAGDVLAAGSARK